jgi:hypothetical protein
LRDELRKRGTISETIEFHSSDPTGIGVVDDYGSDGDGAIDQLEWPNFAENKVLMRHGAT